MEFYTYEIDIDTLETSFSDQVEEEYAHELDDYAEYEESLDGNRVYSESRVSRDHARLLVRDFCDKFAKAAQKIDNEVIDEV